MSQPDPQLSVIIPAYNEAETLLGTLKRIQVHLGSKPSAYEVVVVLDGPTDRTRDVLRDASSVIQHLRIIDRRVNRGKGYTVREGMLQSSGRVRLFTDADNSTDIAHFDQMQPWFDRGYDVVVCSRDPRDAPGAKQIVPQAWHKRWLGKLGNRFVQLLAVKGIWDTQCGFKAFRDQAAREIFSRATIDGWGFDIEALALAKALNYRVGIVPAAWINDPRSHVKLSGYAQVLWETVRVWHNLSRGNYKL